jgi:hypothetical protein
VDRQRPGYQPLVGAILPFSQRHLQAERGSVLHDPQDYSSYEGVLEPAGPGVWFDPDVRDDPRWRKRWDSTQRVELRLTPTRIVLVRRGGSIRRPEPSI